MLPHQYMYPKVTPVQVVEYGDVQFTKTPEVLRAMGLDGLGKTPAALSELREKGVEVAA